MPLTAPIIGLPGWKVVDIYQDGRVNIGKNTVLLLRRTASIGEPLAVDKIITHPIYRGEDQKVVNEATILAEVPHHQNIRKLYSSHVDVPSSGKMSLIFEFCAGGDVGSLSTHAQQAGVCIPETFLWHVIHQALIALEHLHRHNISHNDLHMGNLLLRPVGGDAYPDVVITDFEHANHSLPNERNERPDFVMLAFCMDLFILRMIDETSCPEYPYSQELIEFMMSFFVDKPEPLTLEKEQELIQTSKTMAYGDGKTARQMPPWMIEYFLQLNSAGASSSPEAESAQSARSPRTADQAHVYKL